MDKVSASQYNPEIETIEDLQIGGLLMIQKKKAFRYGMDSVLLADFAKIQSQDTVCDFGTGNGILPLLLYARGKGQRMFAIELMREAADLARRNVALNQLEDRIRVIHEDIANIKHFLKPCSVDSIICNPPYSRPSATLTSPIAEKAIARSQKENTLDIFFASANYILKGKGKIYLVYPAPQMLYLMEKLQKYHLEPKHFRMVFPMESKPANLVLVEAVKDAKPTLHPMPPLIVYQENRSLTNELKSIYHIYD